MKASDLLVIKPPQPGGVFIAPQSLVAFVVSTSIVCTVARAARTLVGIDGESSIATLVAAAVMSAVLFGVTVNDPAARPTRAAAWVGAVAAAGLNGLMLYVAAIGIDKF